MTETASSHREILKSTSLVGGSTLISLAIGVVRTKIFAVLLGPSGMALFGLYGSVVDLATLVSGMGIQSSGVRQVAESNGSNDRERVARTVMTLRRTALVLGCVGAGGLFAFRHHVSLLTFGDTLHARAIGLLSLSVFLGAVCSGQQALLQGLRRLRDLAAVRVVGAALGLLVSLPLVWLWREQGVAPAMVATAAAMVVISWVAARKVALEPLKLRVRDVYHEAKGLILFGFAMMVSGVLTAATMYFIRISIVHELGLDAAGHYQAAFALSGLYVGIIVGAMGADFYPRLTEAAQDDARCNRLINEQSEVALLLAAPGIAVTLALAPVVIRLFYSADFLPAVDVLRWQILGLLGRIMSWPMGFLLLAKKRGGLFVLTETATSLVHLFLVVCLVKIWGLPGTGMAFLGMYLFYTVWIRLVVGRLSGFSWTLDYVMNTGWFGVGVVGVFLANYSSSLSLRYVISIGICLLISQHALRRLCLLTESSGLPVRMRVLLRKFVPRLNGS